MCLPETMYRMFSEVNPLELGSRELSYGTLAERGILDAENYQAEKSHPCVYDR